LRRRARTVADSSGFTLVEAVAAMVIFLIVAAALGGLLTSAIGGTKLARERTIAEQAAMDQIEAIRRMQYDSVGTTAGNPSGSIAPTQTISVRGLNATLTTQISWVNDPTPTSYSSVANYKRISVSVRNNRNNALLTTAVTHLSPPGRSPFGGLNNATINVKVQDMGLAENDLVQGALVRLDTGPSSPLTDTSDANGLVTFPQLTPNPTSGPDSHYDITATKSGFVTYFEDRPPGAAAHVQVAPSQTLGPQVIRLYRPATINVQLLDSGGTPYTQDATIEVTSQRLGTTTSFTTASGSLSLTTFAGEPVVPGDFTVEASTPTALCADPVPHYVPDDYPNVMSTTFTLTLAPCPAGDLDVTVTQVGQPVNGATVTVSGGPYSQSYTRVTDSTGLAPFVDVPEGAGYTVTATNGAQTGSATTAVTVAGPNAVSIALPDPPSGSVVVTVTQVGLPASGAAVSLTGGPFSISVSGTTNSSGQVTFSNVPAGSGYTATATKGSYTASANVTVSTGSNNVPLALPNPPTGNIFVTVQWGSTPSAGASVTVSGGPFGITATGTANASGQLTFSNVPSGTGYTVTATLGGTASQSGVAVSTGSTTNVTVNLPTATLNVNVKRNGNNLQGATVVLTGGPAGVNITNPSVTNSGGNVSFSNVPVGSGYTVTAFRCASSSPDRGTATNVTVNAPSTQVNIAFSGGNTC
jgi:type II secretory pathway pseudopilin PulG